MKPAAVERTHADGILDGGQVVLHEAGRTSRADRVQDPVDVDEQERAATHRTAISVEFVDSTSLSLPRTSIATL